MSVPPELMALLQGGGGIPGSAGGRPAESGLPGQLPPGMEREPGDLDAVEADEDPIGLISEMIDLAQEFLDRDDVPEQGKRIMEDVSTKLRQITASEEKAVEQAQGASGSLISRAPAA